MRRRRELVEGALARVCTRTRRWLSDADVEGACGGPDVAAADGEAAAGATSAAETGGASSSNTRNDIVDRIPLLTSCRTVDDAFVAAEAAGTREVGSSLPAPP